MWANKVSKSQSDSSTYKITCPSSLAFLRVSKRSPRDKQLPGVLSDELCAMVASVLRS